MRITVDTIAETLLTYSWVLLIFGLFLSLLGALGYFDQFGRLPDACETEGPFACLNVEATNASELIFVLRSSQNESVRLMDVQILRMRPLCEGVSDLSGNRQPLPVDIGPLDIVRVAVRCKAAWPSRSVLEGDIVATFINVTGYEINASLFVRTEIIS